MLELAYSNDISHESKRHPRLPTDGRPSTSVEVILRILVIKHLYSWRYDQICQLLASNLALEQFCHGSVEGIPHATTRLRWASLIRLAMLYQLHDHVVDVAG